MTYASRSASFVRRTNTAAVSKAMPVFRTRKRSVWSTSCESPTFEARNEADDQTQPIRSEAFEQMFVASRPKFVATAHSILHNREDAEDAVQNAFLSAYLHLGSFEGRSALSTWFMRIVLNAALMIRRKRKPSTIQALPESGNPPEVNSTENIPASDPDPEMLHAQRETLQLIDGILDKMKPVLRQAFTMTYFDELSRAEASAVLGVSVGTFKARLFRARRQVLDQTQLSLVDSIRKAASSASELFKSNDARVGRELNP